ncbi:MAG: P-II family nitrogen regulator [Oscillospiraceae bacterium]|nr:P-II family nitrogen regulator [Oscillospiraceae bacterium]
MKMIRAIVRPEKSRDVIDALSDKGFNSVTEIDVYGRGKQKGITIGTVKYDELPKIMLLIIVDDEDEKTVVETILENARTGEGTMGDGRIFVIPVESAYTISTREEGI